MSVSQARNDASSAGASSGQPHVGEHADAVTDERVGVGERRGADAVSAACHANYTQRHGDRRRARGPEPPDLSEKGGMKDGQPQRSNERLFMQFLAFGGCADARRSPTRSARAKISGVLYEDVNDPRGIGLLTFSEDPDFFLDRVRPVLNGPGFSALVAEAGIHDARPHLCDRLRAGSARGAAASAAADGAEPGVEVGASGIRCAAAASSRSCRPRNSA